MTTSEKKTLGAAVASLVLGILGMILIGPFGAIPAVICGHIARSKINKNRDTLKGGEIALAGLIMGYISIGIMVIMLPMMAAIAIPSFMRGRTHSRRNGCINNLRMIDAAKEQYAVEWGLSEGSVIEWDQITGAGKYLRDYPLCPVSTTIEGTAANAAHDYTLNPLGVNPSCNIQPDGDMAHALPEY